MQFEHPGDCDECGHSVVGLITVPEDVEPTVVCDECASDVQPDYGVYVKPRESDEQRWFPGDGHREQMSP